MPLSIRKTKLIILPVSVDELIQFRRGLESKVEVKEKENHEISRELTDLRDQLRVSSHFRINETNSFDVVCLCHFESTVSAIKASIGTRIHPKQTSHRIKRDEVYH